MTAVAIQVAIGALALMVLVLAGFRARSGDAGGDGTPDAAADAGGDGGGGGD